METPHTETVVDKAVTFVKDMLGIHTDTAPGVKAQPEYHDAAPEITAENAMGLDPNAQTMQTVGEVNAESYVRPVGDSEVDRLRREVDEHPRATIKLNPESGRLEDDE